MKTTTISKTVANGRVPLGAPPEPSIDIGWQWINPEDAVVLLAKNFERNRNLRAGWVSQLTRMMEEGTFFVSHQGIAFDEEDNLIDGQHRLAAIVKSGKGQWLLVASGVPRISVLAMDRHARRMDYDQIRVATDLVPSAHDVAIARVMHAGESQPTGRCQIDGAELVEFLRRHGDAIAFSQRHGREPKIGTAATHAAVARAWYHEPHNLLIDFMDILHTGLPRSEADLAPVRLREGIFRDATIQRGGKARTDVFLRTCSAIVAFVARNPRTFIRALKESPYPLPTK